MSSEEVVRFRSLISKYRVISEQELGLFLEKQLSKEMTVCQKIIVVGELHKLLGDVPLTAEERGRLHDYCRSFLPWWFRTIRPVCECCLIFGVTTLGYGIGKCICSQISKLWKV